MTYLDRFDRDAGGHVRVVHPGWAPGCTCDECQAVNVSENDAQRDSA